MLPAHYPAEYGLVRCQIGADFGHDAAATAVNRVSPVILVDVSESIVRSTSLCPSSDATVTESLFTLPRGQRVRDQGLLVLRKQLGAVGGRAVVDFSEAKRLWKIYKGPKYGKSRRVITGRLPTLVVARVGSLGMLELQGASVVAHRCTVAHFEILMEAQRGRIRGVPAGSTDAKMRKLWAQSIHQLVGAAASGQPQCGGCSDVWKQWRQWLQW